MSSPKKSTDDLKQDKPRVETPSDRYLKALSLRNFEDVDIIKHEIKSGNILIIRVTALAEKSVDDVKRAVNELNECAKSVGGDIARLGEERIVVTPSWIKIWRRNPQQYQI